MTALSLHDVTRSFGAVHALAGVTADFDADSRTAVVGPSGSGKSTLLHVAAGLDTGYTGTVRRMPTGGTVGYAFQDHRLLPWLSARANVQFALTAAGVPRNDTRRRAAEMLELVGLSASAEVYPARLSGGMRQRVSLARALAVRPALLLLDEPFSAVDEAQADELCAHVRAETIEHGTTMLMVTHRYREAVQLADRAVLLVEGQVRGDVVFPRLEPGLPEVDAAVEQLLRTAVVRASESAVDEVR